MLVLLITGLLDWSCTFTIISICLAVLYTVLLLVCLFYSFCLLRLPCHKRQSQRCFLYLVILQCVLRCVYFFLWPVLIANSAASSHERCGFTIEGEHEGLLLLVIGSLPSALFLSAFTINSFTFSRIYHMTLNHSVTKYRLVLALMLVVNLVTYSSLLFLYVVTFASSASSLSASSPPPSSSASRLSDIAESVYVYALSCSFCVIAASFSFYGIKLWLGVRRSASSSASTLRSSASFSSAEGMTAPYAPRAHVPSFHANSASHHRHHSHGTLSAPFLTPSDSHLSSFSTASSSQSAGGSCLPSYHPMLKLSVVSTLCMLCFLVRVILVPLLSHYSEGQISFPLLLLYHSLSEALPLLLVLYLFDPVREGKGHLLSPAASPALLGTADEQDFQITDDDLFASPREALPGTAGANDSASPAASSAASTPVPTQFSYLGDSLAGSLSSIGSVRAGGAGGAGAGASGGEAVSPRELERRRARSGMSYESAFKQDLKSLLADD